MSGHPCGCDPEENNYACARHRVDLDGVRIRLVPVRSSNIAAIGYDAGTQQLVVEFKGGSRYAYRGVPPETAAHLAAAPSVGGDFAREIRHAGYPFRRISA